MTSHLNKSTGSFAHQLSLGQTLCSAHLSGMVCNVSLLFSRGVKQRAAVRGHCWSFFEPSSVTWSSTQPEVRRRSRSIASRDKWDITAWCQSVKRCNQFISSALTQLANCYLLLFFFLFSAETDWICSRARTYAHTHRRPSPLRIREKHCPVSLRIGRIWGFRLFAVCSAPPADKVSRACRPLRSISRHRHTSKSAPIWVVRLYLLMLLWDTKLNSAVLFDMHNERLLAAHRIMSLSDSRAGGGM